MKLDLYGLNVELVEMTRKEARDYFDLPGFPEDCDFDNALDEAQGKVGTDGAPQYLVIKISE